MKKTPTLVNDFMTVAKLRRIAETMSSDLSEHEDLVQESLLHLWLTEIRRPGQTTSWYLQSCRFHLQHYLARGRSVDSRKRGISRTNLFESNEPLRPELDLTPGCHDASAETYLNDDIRVLSARLTPVEKKMLDYLMDGLTLRDTALKLGISFPTALKRRRRIAALFKRLTQLPLLKLRLSTNGRSNQANSFVLRVKHNGSNSRT
jgi:DNA-directed RNA polymerase specialized sigma24 family protein